MRLEQGTEVRVDIPDKADPDFERYHRRCGTIVVVVEDEVSGLTGDARDDGLYRVKFDDGKEQDFRRRDLRPTPEWPAENSCLFVLNWRTPCRGRV
jgi:hypothetical protein